MLIAFLIRGARIELRLQSVVALTAVVDNLREAIDATMEGRKSATRLWYVGLDVRPMLQQQFAEIEGRDVTKWAGVIKTLGIKGR